jgi:type IV pilus assembly protein PilB
MGAPATVQLPWRRLGALLLSEGLLTPDQLREAFEEQARSGDRFGSIVVERGWVTGADVAMALAKQAGLEFVDLSEVAVEESVLEQLPGHLAKRFLAAPLRVDEDGVTIVGIVDPTNVRATDDIRIAIGAPVRFVVVEAEDLGYLFRRSYRSEVAVEIEDESLDSIEDAVVREEIWDAATGAPAVRYTNSALSKAIEEGASDVHFEPEEDRLVVRARVDGVLQEITTIPKGMQAGVISRLKIMGSLDIAERRAPQDGRILVRYGDTPVDLRIAVLPTTHGEQVVVRVLHRAAAVQSVSALGMSPAAEASFVRACGQPYGAVIVCGPTGSGKTTTLYTALQLLNQPGRALMTIEDPVEYQIPGVAQIEVRPRSGLTFARGLRTILRSDPDVLLVGEIRDDETAGIAIQASMTGHLVLTSLHTHNAASSIARLKDMGVDTSLLAASLNCIVAQRLARRLCESCREPYAPSDAELELVADGRPITPGLVLHRAVGCARCNGTGFKGRVAIYEVMPIQGRVRALIEASTEEIFAAAVEQGMRTMKQDGIRLCLEGIVSLDEINRVTGDRLL